MRKVHMIPAIACLMATLSTATVAAKPALRDVKEVETGLFAISVADKIRRECDDISGRMLKAHIELRDLYEHARSKGYSDAEIEAYVEADAERDRMRAKRDAYLEALGVVQTNPATYCAAGRAEIDKSSRIGALLRAR